MAKVSELKERARAHEKEGEHEKALKIYQHVLKHLEGSPAIKRELPMYVKAGDLQIKLEDKAGAIASYRGVRFQAGTVPTASAAHPVVKTRQHRVRLLTQGYRQQPLPQLPFGWQFPAHSRTCHHKSKHQNSLDWRLLPAFQFYFAT